MANIDSGAPATMISQPVSQPPRHAAEVASAPAPRALTESSVSVVTPPAPAAANPRRVVSGQVYSYMKDGVRHYTSARPRQVASIEGLRTIHYSFIETCYACGAKPGVNFGAIRLNTNAYQQEIAAAAREFGVEESIVRAIIHAESAYNPLALSRAGAQGLMQLMPGTARRFGVSDAYDAAQNIRGGVQYLSWLLKRFNGDLTWPLPAATPARARWTVMAAYRRIARPSGTCNAWAYWPAAIVARRLQPTRAADG